MSKLTPSSHVLFCALVLAIAGCATEGTDASGRYDFEDDLFEVGGGADMISRARIVRDVTLDSTVMGDFERRIRVYGFTFEAKAGAVIHLDLEAFAGPDSIDRMEGEQLDTVASIYGPMDGDRPGPEIGYSDDTDNGVKAELPAIEIQEDGRYLVALSSWDDPGQGRYRLNAECEGTEFQCLRPVEDVPCREGTDYIVGGTQITTATWDRCNVVLLETTVVPEGEILAIQPGVQVKGNYLGTDDYGSVELQVNGSIQAIGTQEHPVRFSALRDGWAGIVLNGTSNTLHHAYVEQARVGITVNGTNNTFEQLNVNSSETGLVFGAGSGENELRGLRIEAVTNGMRFVESSAVIEDSVIKGNYDGEGIGIRGDNGGPSIFSRTLIAGFGTGLHLDSMAFEVTDGIIVNNRRGVIVTGEGAGVTPPHSCPAWPQRAPTPVRPPQRTSWGVDPIFVRCDIVNNEEFAVRIDAPELLVIEDSNVIHNGAGILVEADELHPESRINRNNIYGNGESLTQLVAMHQHGSLDITGNYWAQISDPELSMSWDIDHDPQGSVTCRADRWENSTGCTYNRNTQRHTCGAWTCDRSGNNCSAAGIPEGWSSEVAIEGFSPVELDAGPNLHECTDDVVQTRRVELGDM